MTSSLQTLHFRKGKLHSDMVPYNLRILTHDVDHNWALLRLLDPDLQVSGGIVVPVDKGCPAIIVIDEGAEALVIDQVFLCLFNLDHLKYDKKSIAYLLFQPSTSNCMYWIKTHADFGHAIKNKKKRLRRVTL